MPRNVCVFSGWLVVADSLSRSLSLELRRGFDFAPIVALVAADVSPSTLLLSLRLRRLTTLSRLFSTILRSPLLPLFLRPPWFA